MAKWREEFTKSLQDILQREDAEGFKALCERYKIVGVYRGIPRELEYASGYRVVSACKDVVITKEVVSTFTYPSETVSEGIYRLQPTSSYGWVLYSKYPTMPDDRTRRVLYLGEGAYDRAKGGDE